MTPMARLVKDIFKSFNIVLPVGANGKPSERFPGDEDDPETHPLWLFTPASDLALHKRTVMMVSTTLHAFINDMSEAICGSWNAWKRSATFANVLVNAGVGILPPSGTTGSGDMSKSAILGRMRLDDRNPLWKAYGEAIAGALEVAWGAWVAGYTHPTIPFPAAATIPGPLPPTPNVPIPLMPGMSAGDTMMMAPALAASMTAQFARGGFHAIALFRAFAQAIAQIFAEWKSSNLLSQILASGGAGMPVAGAIGMGGMLVGPDVIAHPQGLKSRLQALKEKLQNLPRPKEIIAEKVSEALHNLKEELLAKLPDIPRPPRPHSPDLPAFPGLPSRPTLPKPGDGSGPTLSKPGDGSGPTLSKPGDGSGPTLPKLGDGSGPTLPKPGDGSGPTLPKPGDGSGPTLPKPGDGSGPTLPKPGDGSGPTLPGGAGAGHNFPGGAGAPQNPDPRPMAPAGNPDPRPMAPAGNSDPRPMAPEGNPAGHSSGGQNTPPRDPLFLAESGKPAPGGAQEPAPRPSSPGFVDQEGNWQWHEAPAHPGKSLGGGPTQPLTPDELEATELVGNLGWRSPASRPELPELNVPLTPRR
ncbi:MAG: hypothetical protein ACKO6N_09690 [Myxococcota bacterium]